MGKFSTMIRIRLFLLIGTLCLVCGVCLLLLESEPALAQSEPDYIGAGECADCHRGVARLHDESRHVLTLQDDEEAILANFEQGEDARQVQFPGDSTPRAFTADDVAYVVGTGRYVQRYLYEVDRNDFRVLPAEWDAVAGEWRPLNLAESWDDPAYDWDQSCAFCHVTGMNMERGRWEDDGVQCEACHGPGEEHAELAGDAGRRPSEEELAEVRAAINPGVDPQICGQCHSQGTNAEDLPFPVGYLPGSSLQEQFTLISLEDTDHWWVTGHARQMNMQYNEWMNSAHSTSLTTLRESDAAEDNCLSCHSADYAYNARLAAAVEAGDREGTAPTAPTLDSAQYGVTCSSCHNPHSEEGLEADLVQEANALCISCHSNENIQSGIHHPVREMFEGTQVIENINPETGVHFITDGGPTCTTCHTAAVPVDSGIRDSHGLDPITPGVVVTQPMLEDSCSGCHGEEASPELLQELIEDIQSNTRERIDTARAAVTETTPEWITQALDFVEGDGSLGIHNYAYSDAVLDEVYEALSLFPPSTP
jgi:predicted CXXCH cytochrome family protein